MQVYGLIEYLHSSEMSKIGRYTTAQLATAKEGKQNMGTVVMFIRVHITNNLTRGVGEFIARAEMGTQTIYITRIIIGLCKFAAE